jgi:serine/threonine protein kinase
VHTNEVRKATDFEGNKTINEYSIIAELGRGAYGKVKLAVNNATNETCAIKIMKKSLLKRGTGDSIVKREIAVMKKLRHRNIVPLMEVLDDDEADKMYLVMKYIDNGTMVHIKGDLTCNTLSADVATQYLRQLISGLTYLHRHGVIHRDLKPDNVMLDMNGIVYLTDFGVSEIMATSSTGISGAEGTPIFLAPELLADVTNAKVDGPPVDVWALGVTFYFALFGTAPFSGQSWSEIADSVVHHAVKFPSDTHAHWVEVLTGLLEKDPKKRLTLSKLKKHPIFDDINRQRALTNGDKDENSWSQSKINPTRHDVGEPGDDPDLDDEEEGTQRIDVTEDEINGSMRKLRRPMDEDHEASFESLSQKVKDNIGSFVFGLRRRVAEKQFEDIGPKVDTPDNTDASATPKAKDKSAVRSSSTLGPEADYFVKSTSTPRGSLDKEKQPIVGSAINARRNNNGHGNHTTTPRTGSGSGGGAHQPTTSRAAVPTPPAGANRNPRVVMRAHATMEPDTGRLPAAGHSPRNSMLMTDGGNNSGSQHTPRVTKAHSSTVDAVPKLPAITSARGPGAAAGSSSRRR